MLAWQILTRRPWPFVHSICYFLLIQKEMVFLKKIKIKPKPQFTNSNFSLKKNLMWRPSTKASADTVRTQISHYNVFIQLKNLYSLKRPLHFSKHQEKKCFVGKTTAPRDHKSNIYLIISYSIFFLLTTHSTYSRHLLWKCVFMPDGSQHSLFKC